MVSIFGGTGYRDQVRALHKGVNVVVACPGRLEDLIERGDVMLDDVTTVVLDEADRMSDMGFLPAVRRLLDQTLVDRQVLLFSATIGREVEAIIRSYQHDPVRVNIEAAEDEKADVTHHFWKVDRAERVADHGQADLASTGRRSSSAGPSVAPTGSSASCRRTACAPCRCTATAPRASASGPSTRSPRGRADALVATDVVARGIHVDDLPCVVHFDPPADHTDYVHRSGRTGRAGRTGTVVSLVTDEQRKDVQGVQRALGHGAGPAGPVLDADAGAATQTEAARRTPRGRPRSRRHGEVLQRGPRLRLLGPRRRRRSVRAPLPDRGRRAPGSGRGLDGGVHRRPWAQGRRGPNVKVVAA